MKVIARQAACVAANLNHFQNPQICTRQHVSVAALAAVEYKLNAEVWRVATGKHKKRRRGAWEESRESWESALLQKVSG